MGADVYKDLAPTVPHAAFVLIKLIPFITPLRADEENEHSGMDLAEAGERAYINADEGM